MAFGCSRARLWHRYHGVIVGAVTFVGIGVASEVCRLGNFVADGGHIIGVGRWPWTVFSSCTRMVGFGWFSCSCVLFVGAFWHHDGGRVDGSEVMMRYLLCQMFQPGTREAQVQTTSSPRHPCLAASCLLHALPRAYH